jgi:tetrahydromethanopterin S-methyltransferase subunit B
MNKIELKNLVMEYFNLAEKQENISVDTPVKENFVEATLADGTKITNMLDADFEVGQELHVITEEGEHVLAPSGEHTTDSGIVITVDGEGIISGVKHPDAEGEGSLAEGVTEEEMSVEDVAEEVIDVAIEEGMTPEAVVEVVKEVIDAVIAPAMEEMKQKMADMEEKMKDYMSATPASQPTTESKFSKETKDLGFLDNSFNINKAQYAEVLARTNKK